MLAAAYQDRLSRQAKLASQTRPRSRFTPVHPITTLAAPAVPPHGEVPSAQSEEQHPLVAAGTAAAGGGGGGAGRQDRAAELGIMTSSTAHSIVGHQVPGKLERSAQLARLPKLQRPFPGGDVGVCLDLAEEQVPAAGAWAQLLADVAGALPLYCESERQEDLLWMQHTADAMQKDGPLTGTSLCLGVDQRSGDGKEGALGQRGVLPAVVASAATAGATGHQVRAAGEGKAWTWLGSAMGEPCGTSPNGSGSYRLHQGVGGGGPSCLGPLDVVNGLGGCCSFKDVYTPATTAHSDAGAASHSSGLPTWAADVGPPKRPQAYLQSMPNSMEGLEAATPSSTAAPAAGSAAEPAATAAATPATSAAAPAPAANAYFCGRYWGQDELAAMERVGWGFNDVGAVAASLAGWDIRPSATVISALVQGYTAEEAKGLVGPRATDLDVLHSGDFGGLCRALIKAVVKQGRAESTIPNADGGKAVREARFVFITAYAYCRVARPASAASGAAAAAAKGQADGMREQDKQPKGGCRAAPAGGVVAGTQGAAHALNTQLQPRGSAIRRKGAKLQTATAGTSVMDAADLAKAAAAAEAVAAQLIAEEEEHALAVAAAAASKAKAKGRARQKSQQSTARANVGAAQGTVVGKKQDRRGATDANTEEQAAVGGDSARHGLPAVGGAYGNVGMHEGKGKARALIKPGPEAQLKPRHGAEAVPTAASTTAGSMERAALTSPAAAAKGPVGYGTKQLGAGRPPVAVAKVGGKAAAATRGSCKDGAQQLGAGAGGTYGHTVEQPAAKEAAAGVAASEDVEEQLGAARSAATDDVSALVGLLRSREASLPSAVAEDNGAPRPGAAAACTSAALEPAVRQGPATPLALQDLILSSRNNSSSSKYHSQQVHKPCLAMECLQKGAADATALSCGSSSNSSGFGGSKAGAYCSASASSSSRGAEAAEEELSTAEPQHSGALVRGSALASVAGSATSTFITSRDHKSSSTRISCSPSLGPAASTPAIGSGGNGRYSSSSSSTLHAVRASNGNLPNTGTALQRPMHYPGSSSSSSMERSGRMMTRVPEEAEVAGGYSLVGSQQTALSVVLSETMKTRAGASGGGGSVLHAFCEGAPAPSVAPGTIVDTKVTAAASVASSVGAVAAATSVACLPVVGQDAVPSGSIPPRMINGPDQTKGKLRRGKKDSKTRTWEPCVVCWEARPCVVLLPCKHLALCEDCSQLLGSKGADCPMCRQPVDQHMVIYHL